MNLLKETIKKLKYEGKKAQDVIWCGSKDFRFSWKKFKEVANFDYNNGFGGQEVAEDLKIVGKDFWLERHEYDGSEWWEYKEMPEKTKKTIKNPKLTVREYGCWLTLKEMSEHVEKN